MLSVRERLKSAEEALFRHPARVGGVLAALGDAGMAVSGFVFENLGRLTSGLMGSCANLPIVFFSGRTRKEGEIDPQDLPFRQRIKHIWKFWKYPFEFGAVANMAQTFSMGLFSGPDTVSKVGEAANVPVLLSNDQFRIAETTVGFGGVVISAMSLIREADKSSSVPVPEVKGFFPNLKKDWDGVSGFIRNRGRDLVSEGIRLDKSIAKAFENACLEIAVAGPNKVTAKSFNALIYPWAIESAFRGDWSNVASACFYRTCNYFFAKSSKRAASTAPSLS